MAQDTTALYGTLHGYTEGNGIYAHSPSFEQRGGARINRRTGRDDVIDQDTPAASQTRRRLDVKGAGNIDETFLFVQRGLRRCVLVPSYNQSIERCTIRCCAPPCSYLFCLIVTALTTSRRVNRDGNDKCITLEYVDFGEILKPRTKLTRESASTRILDCMDRCIDRRTTSNRPQCMR